MRFKGNLKADGALLLTTIIWGSTFVTAKDVLTQWPPAAYMALRFALAIGLLLLLFPKWLVRARAREWKMGATLGLLMGGGFALQAVGLIYTTTSKSAFITGLTTLLVPFVALALLRVRPNMENLIGVTLASTGGALILTPHEGSVNTGDLLTLASTFLFAFHVTLMSVYARRVPARQLAMLQIITAGICFIALWLAVKAYSVVYSAGALPAMLAREVAPLQWNGRVLWQIFYLATIATIISFLLWSWAQARMSATHAAIIFSLEPVFATAFAVAIFGAGEWMGTRGNIGAALILAGVIISELHLRRRRPTDAPAAFDEDDDISLAPE